MEDIEDIKAEYATLAHAMQTGVKMMMNYEPSETTPKHLRVGVNSALVDSGALAGLLLAKGIITEREYFAALRDKMREEVNSYQSMIQQKMGGETKITLA